MTSPYYDRSGRAISLREWTTLMEDDDYRVVDQTYVTERWFVSTVWIGIALGTSFLFDGPPLIFETMVFDHAPDTGDPWYSSDQERYATEDEAFDGHHRMVALVEDRGTERSHRAR